MDVGFNKNEDVNKQLVYQLKSRLKKVYQGGGEKAALKHQERGKLLARTRINYLLDKDSSVDGNWGTCG